eukprot:3105088-Amphidinium_carterae.1
MLAAKSTVLDLSVGVKTSAPFALTGDPNVSCAPSGAYVLVLSDGSMRQLTVPEMRTIGQTTTSDSMRWSSESLVLMLFSTSAGTCARVMELRCA